MQVVGWQEKYFSQNSKIAIVKFGSEILLLSWANWAPLVTQNNILVLIFNYKSITTGLLCLFQAQNIKNL